jgi:hypothetical protein
MAEDARIPQFGAEARRELFHQRVLVLDGPLDDDNGTLIATQLLALAADDDAADIALWIHSPGGSVPSMLAIRDVMRLIPNDVATLALGLACSAGQFLLSAGARGKRRAQPHARIRRTAHDLQRTVARESAGLHAAHTQLVGVGMRLAFDDLAHHHARERRRDRTQVFDLHARHREQLGQLRRRERRIAELAQPGLWELHRRLT